MGLRFIPSLLQRKLPVGWARSTRGQAALLQEKKAARRVCVCVYLFLAVCRIHVCVCLLARVYMIGVEIKEQNTSQ